MDGSDAGKGPASEALWWTYLKVLQLRNNRHLKAKLCSPGAIRHPIYPCYFGCMQKQYRSMLSEEEKHSKRLMQRFTKRNLFIEIPSSSGVMLQNVPFCHKKTYAFIDLMLLFLCEIFSPSQINLSDCGHALLEHSFLYIYINGDLLVNMPVDKLWKTYDPMSLTTKYRLYQNGTCFTVANQYWSWLSSPLPLKAFYLFSYVDCAVNESVHHISGWTPYLDQRNVKLCGYVLFVLSFPPPVSVASGLDGGSWPGPLPLLSQRTVAPAQLYREHWHWEQGPWDAKLALPAVRSAPAGCPCPLSPTWHWYPVSNCSESTQLQFCLAVQWPHVNINGGLLNYICVMFQWVLFLFSFFNKYSIEHHNTLQDCVFLSSMFWIFVISEVFI